MCVCVSFTGGILAWWDEIVTSAQLDVFHSVIEQTTTDCVQSMIEYVQDIFGWSDVRFMLEVLKAWHLIDDRWRNSDLHQRSR